MKKLPILMLSALTAAFSPLSAETVEFDLTISYATVRPTGKPRRAMVVNGGIPAPTLEFTEGDDVVVRVKNELDETTSIHWHGLILPNRQDGVPNLTTHPIPAGGTHTYRFPANHSGTYWYHSHTGLQEERGVYGGIIIHPKEQSEGAPRDEVVVLSDWIDENPEHVLKTLKRGGEWYAAKKGSRPNIVDALRKRRFGAFLRRAASRMHGVDISDVAYDAYLVHGARSRRLVATPGEEIRLRFINASASTYFYLNSSAGPLRLIAADGIDVVPVEVERLLIGVAETYDVLFKVPVERATEVLVTAQDGSGTASLIVGEGAPTPAERVPRPDFYKLSDPRNMPMMKVTGVGMIMPMDRKFPSGKTPGVPEQSVPSPPRKRNDFGVTPGRPSTPYSRLEALEETRLPSGRPWREYTFKLQGDMNRYVWQMNGQVLSESDKVQIRKGENVRFRLINQTMMNHPMHLHGHFFRVLNEHGAKSPWKHTVDVPPMGMRVIEFAGSEDKDWFFHCHVLYHMEGGMTRVISYADQPPDDDILAIQPRLFQDKEFEWGRLTLLGQMYELGFDRVSTRHSQRLRIEGDYDGEAEAEFFLERYSNRFWTTFVGLDAERSSSGSEAVGVAGIRTLLPMNIALTLWVDHEGDGRATTSWHVPITRRLSAEWMLEYDTAAGNEWEVEVNYMLGRDTSILWRRDSDFGTGFGVTTWF